MSVIIRNIGAYRCKKCKYELRINLTKLVEFHHNRSDGLATLLRRAANAIPKEDKK